MPRPPRPLVAHGIYHVFSRARPELALFNSDGERAMFLELVERTVAGHGWSCLAYCLMTTHFHLVVKTAEPNLDVGMQRLLSTYATRLHERRGTRGPVFGGRYGAVLVCSDAQLIEVLRYVALNPVRGGLCAQPSRWRWSSHRALAGETLTGFVAVADVHRHIAGITGRRGADGYVAVVREAVGAGQVEHDPSLCASPPVPEARRALADLLLEGDLRAVAVAHYEHGYSLRRIARELDVSVSTLSRRLRRAKGDATQRV
jgi:putative transposase